ncbi:MarC family protein [Paracidovorax sp. MALMAid1276]|uniref:MarC family protein n=1 Tax=Paracidovorax sp. MALMAid1276 TaxID=3411631 RepID=UPI003B9A79F4
MSIDPLSLLLVAGKSFLLVLATLLPILNPAATAPIFLGLTEGASDDTRRLLARRIATNMVVLITGAMLVGSYVLDLFGISLPIVRVAGGSLIAANAWRLLAVGPSTRDSRQALADAFTPEMARTHAFYPLTFPISCGPGSLAAAITIGVTLHEDQLAPSLARIAGGFGGLVVIGCVLFVAFRYATQLLKPLGETGTTVFLRLSAFILLCLGVQIVWDGISELVRGL